MSSRSYAPSFALLTLVMLTGCSGGYLTRPIGIELDGGDDDASDALTIDFDAAAPDGPVVPVDPPPDASKPSSLLKLSEIAPNVSGGGDVIELRASGAGSIGGYTVEQDITNAVVLATLPAITVAQGDIVVVHLIAPSGTTNETSSKSGCSSSACYPTAWDVVGGSTGITFSGRVIVIRRPDKAIADGAPFYRNGLASGAGFAGELSALQKAGHWLPATCNGGVCSSNELAEPLAVDWLGVGTSTTSTTIARKGTLDTDRASDWTLGPSSLGVTNPL